MHLKYVDKWKGLEWVHLAQDIVMLRTFMNTVMNLLFQKKKKNREELRKISYFQKMSALHGLSRFRKPTPQ